MKKLKVELVNDDWTRCYVDGVIVCENHSISVGGQYEFTELAKALGFEVEVVSVDEEPVGNGS